MPTLLIVLGLLALLLLLAGTLWIELVITCSSNNLRFGLCWHWSKYQVAIPLYQFQLRTAKTHRNNAPSVIIKPEVG